MSAVEEVKAVLPTLRYPFSLHGDCVPCELAFRHAERLDALEGENERLRAELAECARWRADLADKLHAAEAELATARDDALDSTTTGLPAPARSEPFNCGDGFGNSWQCIKGLGTGKCELEIVRPGKVQCNKCDRESPPTQVPTSASSGDSIETGATPAPGGGFVVLVGQLRAMSRFVHADHSLGDKAADAIEEVVRKWGEEIERRKQTQAELAGETERAEAAERERDALRQDAERYRWLRSVSVHNGDYLPERFWELLGDELDEDFDAAIDRARRG